MKKEDKMVLWFDELELADIPQVGGKNASLGEMRRELIPKGVSIAQVLEDQDLITPLPLRLNLPDPDDAMFLEVAAATEDKVLVTGNIRHFPVRSRGVVKVITPAEAWAWHCELES